LEDGDRVDLELGEGERRCLLPQVLVRAGEGHATELHIDTDEAHAFGVTTGCPVTVVGKSGGDGKGTSAAKVDRPLVTERDVTRFAESGQTLSYDSKYIITPAAMDRAKAVGIWRGDK
jgi:hypothetical protein